MKGTLSGVKGPFFALRGCAKGEDEGGPLKGNKRAKKCLTNPQAFTQADSTFYFLFFIFSF